MYFCSERIYRIVIERWVDLLQKPLDCDKKRFKNPLTLYFRVWIVSKTFNQNAKHLQEILNLCWEDVLNTFSNLLSQAKHCTQCDNVEYILH